MDTFDKIMVLTLLAAIFFSVCMNRGSLGRIEKHLKIERPE